jgi:hypothetical protein
MRVFWIITVVFSLIIFSCTHTPKRVASIKMGELIVYGYDANNNGDIDYWQHFDCYGNKVGSPIFVKRK